METLFAEGIGKSYKGRQVVRGVDLGISRGEVVGLLGPNGAGKTTCFYIIVGLVAPEAGRVMVDENDITRLPMYLRARLHGTAERIVLGLKALSGGGILEMLGCTPRLGCALPALDRGDLRCLRFGCPACGIATRTGALRPGTG